MKTVLAMTNESLNLVVAIRVNDSFETPEAVVTNNETAFKAAIIRDFVKGTPEDKDLAIKLMLLVNATKIVEDANLKMSDCVIMED